MPAKANNVYFVTALCTGIAAFSIVLPIAKVNAGEWTIPVTASDLVFQTVDTAPNRDAQVGSLAHK